MKVLLVLFFAFAAFVYLPSAAAPAAATNRSDCAMNTPVPYGPPIIPSGRCAPGQAANSGVGDASRGQNSNGASARSGQAPQNSGAGEAARGSASAKAKVHTVQVGENLSKIAQTYDTSLEALLLANPEIVNPHLIRVDAKLKIPTPEETERLRSEAEKRRIAQQRQIVSSVPHDGERWVDVDLQTQTVRAYEGDTLMGTFIASTGTANHPTVTGQFRVWLKLNTDDMKGPGYNLKDVPYVMYFFEDYALHGTYWHNNFGTPMSHGCVNLRTEDAAWLFDFGYEGMLVNVH